MTITRKAHTKTEKESCVSSRYKPHPCSRITHEYSFLSLFPNPSLSPRPSYIFDVSDQIGLRSWLANKGSCFSILWPLNKACDVPVSASVSLLVVQIRLEKEPPWPRQGVSGQARTPAQVQLFN